MVNKCPYQLILENYDHFTSAYVKLERFEKKITQLCGLQIYAEQGITFEKSNRNGEVSISGKVPRIKLVPNTLNLKIASELTPRFPKRTRMYNNDSFNKSILKQNKENECKTPSKTVSFNNTFYITPISPRHHEKSPTPVKDYEFAYKEYLKSVQMNGATLRTASEKEKVVATVTEVAPAPPDPKSEPESEPNNTNNETNNLANETENLANELANDVTEIIDDDDLDGEYMDVEYLEEPKRKRGRPKGSGRFKLPPPVIIKTQTSPPKKRGWPLGLSRKTYAMTMKARTVPVASPVYTGPPRKRGRPRKIIAFGFQTIVSDIKTVVLPSDLWSAHVSVTAKKSQVCFTRVVQAVSNTVPVECDRSVKFNGTVNYLVRINNRDVELLAAPPTVNSLRDVEILLDIVNEIGINDPVLEYHNR